MRLSSRQDGSGHVKSPDPIAQITRLFPPDRFGGSCVASRLCKDPKQDQEGPREEPRPTKRSLFDDTSATSLSPLPPQKTCERTHPSFPIRLPDLTPRSGCRVKRVFVVVPRDLQHTSLNESGGVRAHGAYASLRRRGMPKASVRAFTAGNSWGELAGKLPSPVSSLTQRCYRRRNWKHSGKVCGKK